MFDIPESEKNFAIEKALIDRLSMLIKEHASEFTAEEPDKTYAETFHEGIDFALSVIENYVERKEALIEMIRMGWIGTKKE